MRLSAPFLFALLPACSGPPDTASDRVFVNGAVYTVDAERSWADAVAIANGEIVFVGSNNDAEAFIGENTEVTDLDGNMLMPGFHDAHAHVFYGGMAEGECDLRDELDVAEIRAILIECKDRFSYGPDEWVLGGQWPLAAFPDGNPSKDMLDEIFGDRPALFVDSFGHNGWINSRALEIAGINLDTRDPEQGVIVRDPASGEPTGTLRDAAMDLVEAHLPEATGEERYAGLMAGLKRVNEFGITAYTEPGVAAEIVAPYVLADQRGELTARVLVSLSPISALPGKFGPEIFELLARRDQYRGTYLSAESVKVYIDGVIETRTSYMLEPYVDGSNFPPFYERAELFDLFQRLDAMGLQIHSHAIGDAAIRFALDAYEHAQLENGLTDNRHQIVHLQLVDDKDIPRFAELDVAADFQCMWCYPDVYIDYAIDLVGMDRVQQFYPVRRVLESGALLVGGSDWTVSSLNPLDAIETAVRRQSPFDDDGPVLGTNEAIDLAAALDMYTRNAAYLMRLEHKTGSIEVGKRADLIVLDRNLFEVPATRINDASVLLTMMDGRVVYVADE